jgi:hypothetical protein
MKYIVMEEARRGDSDCFTKEFDSREEAITAADIQWGYLTAREQEKNTVYVIESINPDEEAEDHFDGFPIWQDGEEIQ